MSTTELEALKTAILARETARFLSIATTVTLLYDHLLLLDKEIRFIWKAAWSKWKGAFLANRYVVPACLIVAAYQESLISSGGYSDRLCKTVFTILPLVATLSLAVTNAFVFFRVHSIWGYNPKMRQVLVVVYVGVYIATICLCIAALSLEGIPKIYYSPLLKECAVTGRLPLIAATFSLPLVLDIILITLTVVNSFFRPLASEHSNLTKELFRDGAVYFVVSLSLRIFNLIVYTSLNISYSSLPCAFVWGGITLTVNRMVLLGTEEASKIQHQGYDPEVRALGQTDVPFKLSQEEVPGEPRTGDFNRKSMDEEQRSIILDLRRTSSISFYKMEIEEARDKSRRESLVLDIK